MGDRAVVVFKGDDGLSCGVYVHWLGSMVPELLKSNSELLRKNDESCSCARFCFACCNVHPSDNSSVGIIEGPDGDDYSTLFEYQHGDAGVFVVDVGTGEVRNVGGDEKAFTIKVGP